MLQTFKHEWGKETIRTSSGGLESSTLGVLTGGHGMTDEARIKSITRSFVEASQGSFCLRCNAWRGVLGLEPTPELYIQHIVEVFREVRRVLRKDGTVWLNLGDSYATQRNDHEGGGFAEAWKDRPGGKPRPGTAPKKGWHGGDFLKPKDLCGIPWRVALALQADGWWLRSDIIWSKPNPMPESVTDRPTKAHEYIFLLTKQADYYYDGDAVREPHARLWDESNGGGFAKIDHVNAQKRRISQASNHYRDYPLPNPAGRNRRSVWEIATQPMSDWAKTVRWYRVSMDEISDDTLRIASRDCPKHGGLFVLPSSALCDEHAASYLIHNFDKRNHLFPRHVVDSVPIARLLEHLIETDNSGLLSPECVLFANGHSNESHKTVHALLTNPSCIVCGKKPLHTADKIEGLLKDDSVVRKLLNNTEPGDLVYHPLVQIVSRNAGRSCCCAYYRKKTEETSHFATFPEDLIKPCILAGAPAGGIVFDPFGGSMTVVKVAQDLGRIGIGMDLKPEYISMGKRRAAQMGLGI